MKKILLTMVGLFVLAPLCDIPTEVDARRLGGGRSFGSRPQYQRSAPPPASPQRDAAGSYQRQDPAQTARPAGPLGGGRGLFGGLLAGGIIGSLLFGGHGMGGPGLLDFLLIGGGLLLLFRYLAARRTAVETAGRMPFEAQTPLGGGGARVPPPAGNIPADFDETEFLKGAKAAYTRLQSSWDKRDLEDIRQFTSPEVWEEIRAQAEEDPTPGQTGIVLLKANLLEVKPVDDRMVATVFFDALLREKPEDSEPEAAQELWHFSRTESGPESFWRLEGIQQVAEGET